MRLSFHALSAGLCVALLATAAHAFEKQQLGTPAGSSSGSQVPGAKLADPSAAASAAKERGASGTAITIPGLGTVGVIPKMDFGMELLYGADSKPQAEVAPEVVEDGLQIRGTIKHRF